ncbi:class I SAM-dependent methyltransferase [Tenacibaculum sp. IB213877]|uniref:class I SAM-dependent methyltransferase n=1 Tax=Tenacibaculum sp. IB213877 TaxID=3097351 RepID=UPI002A598F3A|nr:class I SAM-dependent methyltransferase [Tenacibaculum sp. IB213877]MDY0779463.1 class I SAM-dependent methyltransferase [Tenacibaculum sp. IB213877]
MNSNILHIDVQQFIEKNLTTKITNLVLKGSPFPKISSQELANQVASKQKSEQKLPTWFQTKNIYYPPKLSIEQTSSEITAEYKSKIVSGKSIIDITGGFGVDTYYFSKTFENVIHCEINKELSKIVSHNFQQLQLNNVKTVAEDGLLFLHNSSKKYDCIYIDPSRRDNSKGKVFLLKDCLPNVPENIDFLFSKSTSILIKNSPLLDITSTIHELKFVKEIHVVAVQNEVKELLFLLEKDYTESITIKTINLLKNKEPEFFEFTYKSEVNSTYELPEKYLYEPNAAILKSGGFQQIAFQFNIHKLHLHSHLYTSNKLICFPGRKFKIINTLNYDKKELKKLTQGKANITTRNFPKKVEQVRKETKIKDGGSIYVFLTTNKNGKLCSILCEKV